MNWKNEIVLLIAFLAILSAPSYAQVRGAYSPGSSLTSGGTVPDPGFYYTNQVWYGTSDQYNDRNGASFSLPDPIDSWVENNTLTYVPQFKILGANLELALTLSISNGVYSAYTPPSAGPTVNGEDSSSVAFTNTKVVQIFGRDKMIRLITL